MSESCESKRCLPSILLVVLLFAGTFPLQAENHWDQLPPTPGLPKPERSGTATVNGGRLWYAVFGHGSPVIFLHGGLANSNYWGLQIAAIAKALKYLGE